MTYYWFLGGSEEVTCGQVKQNTSHASVSVVFGLLFALPFVALDCVVPLKFCFNHEQRDKTEKVSKISFQEIIFILVS